MSADRSGRLFLAKVIKVGFILILLSFFSLQLGTSRVYAAKNNNEIDAYEKFLKHRQTFSCQGKTTSFNADAFNVVDMDNDNVYELLIADKDVCANKYLPGHTHVTLYRYFGNKMVEVNGILTKKGGESTVYISRLNSKVAVKAYSGDWLTLSPYGDHENLGKSPSFSGYKKYKLYKNTASNREKYLSKAKKRSALIKKYEKKILDIEKKFEKQEKSMNKNGKKVYDKVSGAYDSLKKDSLETLSRKIDTLLASNLPESAEKALVKVFTDTVQEQLIVKSTTYDKCKTAPQLVNKVASQIMNESGSFSFVDKKITYTASFNSLGTVGATYVSGTIMSSRGITYHFGGTVVSKAAVNEELSNLKKYSDKKIEEAKKAVFTDSADILAPAKLRTYLKTASKSKLYKTIKKKSPSAAKIVKKGTDMIDKFLSVKKAYAGIKSIDLKDASEDKIVKTIANYDKKVKAYEKAIDDLFE